jgi:ferric-dicitrate binding protein FerR (iron transport regulator)
VLPGGNRALLTLANGSSIVLDSAADGILAQQGNTRIKKLNGGQIVYSVPGMKPEAVFYNVLTTPRGGQYRLALPDGSQVWLNAASSIRYPTAFTGRERRVEITGEAYFEIAKNPQMPFYVKVNDMQVEVLGTHFNVMAYANEDAVRTTLLEGSVKVNRGSSTVFLKPGQQSALGEKGAVSVIDGADTEEAVAWKNGLFEFDNVSIETVLRQISRWYDVDVQYEGNTMPSHFGGQISRYSNLSQVLKILELSGIHFRIEGKRLIVLQR